MVLPSCLPVVAVAAIASRTDPTVPAPAVVTARPVAAVIGRAPDPCAISAAYVSAPHISVPVGGPVPPATMPTTAPTSTNVPANAPIPAYAPATPTPATPAYLCDNAIVWGNTGFGRRKRSGRCRVNRSDVAQSHETADGKDQYRGIETAHLSISLSSRFPAPTNITPVASV